jgi:hypothetical protein
VVWVRDPGRCTFVSKDGHRCDERGFLEFHHIIPYAAGGRATVENLTLRCASHNRHEADVYFGTRRPDTIREPVAEYGANEPAGSEPGLSFVDNSAPRLDGAARIEALGDDADLQEIYDTERQLLYVACTRARDFLSVSALAPPSEFLDDEAPTPRAGPSRACRIRPPPRSARAPPGSAGRPGTGPARDAW